MKRAAYKQLLDWKQQSNRKPLIIQGARQVGKTYLMKSFGAAEYQDVAYFNFEITRTLSAIFQKGYAITSMISSLEILHGKPINPSETLIIFDEIQACPEALTALKYFYEEAPEYHIFAAGSMLGVAIHQGVSFPVGKVSFLPLYPLSFHEFLEASGAQSLLQAIDKDQLDILQMLALELLDYYKMYCFLGGMPEVLKNYFEYNDLNRARGIQNDILQSYENDFSKHAPIAQLPRIRMVWQSIVPQLAKENSKFLYSFLRTGGRAKEFEMAIEWLKDAGVIHKVVRLSKPGIPITSYADFSDFKIYLSDVGLLGAMANLPIDVVLEGHRLFEEFKGVMAEQIICQLLLSNGHSAHYWSPEAGKSEVDFVIQKDMRIVPIEVKSGENLRSRSLRVYFDKYQPQECIRTSLAGYQKQDWVKNIPMYLFERWLNRESLL
jgi:predicted AAA+ superfamily ATPase